MELFAWPFAHFLSSKTAFLQVMITTENFKHLLINLGFAPLKDNVSSIFAKRVGNATLKVNFTGRKIKYPDGVTINREDTLNFSSSENFVVFECVHRLLEKGYRAQDIELEPVYKVGRGASGGRADILVKNQEGKPLLLIECKTWGKEFNDAWQKTLKDGDQLFSYAQQISEVSYLCLYASNFDGEECRHNYYVIAHKDGKDVLEQGSVAKSYANAKNVGARFFAWEKTYGQAFEAAGIFEATVPAYDIGNNKYTWEDNTAEINVEDKEGKYHEFRTILRKHNIGRRENAFEVLVNLFLCKIVDEGENKGDLQFYWKGKVFDNYFDFADRLQALYQKGMRKFLEEDIVYISESDIDNAFWMVYKNPRNAAKDKIKEYFRQLKFFNNSAFSFVDTHNRALFEKNSKVLAEMVQMWQKLRLKTVAQNQFLGDMFEYFLDNSVKQSNGQFFTPLPICKFIVSSLPLARMAKKKADPLRMIDFACGAGHFLNEYAQQIKPLAKDKKPDVTDYYANIIGIEKEARLAKVAKVAAFMYGQDQIKVLDADGLAINDKVKDGSFDILAANPPFSVDGFLQTLDKKNRERFALAETASDNADIIQCFFVERIAQLMAPGGVVGVILPQSLLTNQDNSHVRAREILLRLFDWIAIVELGNGAFGKTGTNTIVLFLRRRDKKPEMAEHYQNRVADFFNGDQDEKVYKDLYLVEAYCKRIDAPFDEYKKLFGAPSADELEALLKREVFAEYKDDFAKSAQAKSLQKTQWFKKMSAAEQGAELHEQFVAFAQGKEKDKLLYFILAHAQANDVLIVSAPKTDKERKQFRGYEWSAAKGREGIVYIGGETVADIVTPLFDPSDFNNREKINVAIRSNFNGGVKSQSLPPYCRYAPLTNMLDFGRLVFDKGVKLSAEMSIRSRHEMVSLRDVADIVAGQSPDSSHYNEDKKGLPFYQGKKDFGKISLNPPKVWTSRVTQESRRGDILFSVRAPVGDVNFNPFEKICIGRGLAAIRAKGEICLQEYIFYIIHLQKEFFQGSAGSSFDSISKDALAEKKIPLPPIGIQKKIARECAAIDAEAGKAQAAIDAARKSIAQKLGRFAKFPKKELGGIVSSYETGSRPKGGVGGIFSGAFSLGGEHIHPENGRVDLKSPKYVPVDFYEKETAGKLQEGDILLCKDGALTGKVALLRDELAGQKAMVNEHVFLLRCQSPHTQRHLFYFLLSDEGQAELKKRVTGSAQGGLNTTNLREIPVPVPPEKEQKKFAQEAEKLEAEIAKARGLIDSAAERKNAVLEKHLN